MPLDTSSFSAIEEADTKYRLQAIKDNTKLIMEVEEGIRYQYELHEQTASYLNSKFPEYNPDNISSADKRIAISHSLYTQNFKAIHAEYTIILSGKISTSRMIVRRIHESIIAQYYIGLCDENEFSEYVELSEKDHTQQTKLGYNFYKQKLYEGNIFNNMSEVYSKLSDFTHITWKTLFDIEYNQDLVKDAFLNLRHNLLFNVLSYCQVYAFDQSFIKILLEFVQSFVDEQLHNSNYQLNAMFPNKKNIVDRLLWDPDRKN